MKRLLRGARHPGDAHQVRGVIPSLPVQFDVPGVRKEFQGAQNVRELQLQPQKEYVQWIIDAKRGETRKKRLKTAIQWLSEGKPQNWRYV